MSLYRLKGTAGVVTNHSFALAEKLTIGRAGDCAIRVDEDGVMPRHAEIVIQDDGTVLLRSLDMAAPVYVNGIETSGQLLSSGDELRIGTSRLILQAPGLRPARVLHPEAAQSTRRRWPWLLMLAFAAGAAAVAWHQGWIAF